MSSEVGVGRGLAPYEELRGFAGMATPELDQFGDAQAAHTRRFTPRRNRWADVQAFDARVVELEARQGALMATANALGEKLAKAPAADQDRLAAWQLAGARGPRPEPTVEPIEQELRVARADLEALTGAIHRTLGEKADYVAKHRKRLVKDAAKAKEEVYARAVRLVEELEQARVEMLEARDGELWAHLFPGEVATDQVQYRDALIGARLEPLKRIFGLTSQIKFNQVIAGLRADLDFARDAASPAQRRELAGASGRDPRGAVWKDTPEGEAQIRAEHQAAVDSVRNRPGSEWVA